MNGSLTWQKFTKKSFCFSLDNVPTICHEDHELGESSSQQDFSLTTQLLGLNLSASYSGE